MHGSYQTCAVTFPQVMSIIGPVTNRATQAFYGHSFIADHRGELVACFGDKEEGVLTSCFDLDAIARYRAEWGFFRDRRTDLYAKSIL